MKIFKVLLPIVVLSGGALGAFALIAARPEVEQKQIAHELPVVEVVVARPQAVRLNVHSQGVVAPRTKIDLVSEVSGKVIKVHPAFAAGGFFKAGEVLVGIDPRDYAFSVTRTQAQVAEARLQRARCELRAPFHGRVRTKQVDSGQYVPAGTVLARIYAIDVAEVRLPITNDQLDLVALPLSYRDAQDPGLRPGVTLSAQLGGQTHQWQGEIVRTEGAFDDQTGTLYAIARIPDPYGYRQGAPPLAVGLFVQAEIRGRERSNVLALPRTALVRGAYQVLVVDKEDHLRFRDIAVLRGDREQVFVSNGVKPGERVIVSALDTPVEGMRVKAMALGHRL